MLNHRSLESADTDIISTFPQSEEELFFMFPKAEYPLQPAFLLKEAEKRFYPTIVMSGDTLAGYGNFIYVEHGDSCSIGNVVVNPEIRQKGVASYLVETLLAIAFDQLKVRYVRISCFNANTPGLLLYRKLGFEPVDMEVRFTRNKQRVALIHMHKLAR